MDKNQGGAGRFKGLMGLVGGMLLITGCGDGGGGSGNTISEDDPGTVGGVVVDPAITGAAVRAVDTEGEALSRTSRTGEDGSFSLELEGTAQGHLRIIARGGIDTGTGQELQGLTLSAIRDGDGDVVVSPLTSLVAHRVREDGLTVTDARGQVANELGLEAEEVAGDPRDHAGAQRASLLVTELLVALRGTEDRLARVDDALQGASGGFSTAASALGTDGELNQGIRERLARVETRAEALEAMDPTATSAADMVRSLGLEHIRSGIEEYLAESGVTSPAEAPVEALAEAIWKGAGQRAMPSDSAALANTLRYVFTTHGITAGDFTDPDATLPTDAVGRDSVLSRLARSRVIDTSIPLASSETLGSDNTARLEYFFRSDASPFHRSEALIEGVGDDATRDPVYGSIAQGLAAAGLLERADLVLQSRIFQPPERAAAMQDIGDQQYALGETDVAEDYWGDALATYQDHFDEVRGGAANMTADDATFFMGLRASFEQAGLKEQADEAMETVRAFIEGNGGTYTTAYGRLSTAARNATEDAVSALEEGGSARRVRAESALDLFGEAVSGLGDTGVACNLKSMYLTDYADLALRLGERSSAAGALDDYESLVEGTGCADFAAGRAGDMASVYGRLGELQRFNTLVDNEVAPRDPDDAAEARGRLAVYEALEMARSGNVGGAIDHVEAAPQTDIQDRIEYLTYIGTGRTQNGRPYLARLLQGEGETQSARQVADAAWDLAMSDDFATEAGGKASDFVGQGCRKVARLYEWLGQPDQARQRAGECATRSESVFASAATAERAEVVEQLGYLHLWVGLDDEAADFADTLYNRGTALGLEERLANRRAVAELRSATGDAAGALSVLDGAVRELPGLANVNSGDEAIEDALDQAVYTARNYFQVGRDVRKRVTESGFADVQQHNWVQEARAAMVGLMTDGSDLPGNWTGARGLIDALNDPDEGAQRGSEATGILAAARSWEEAEAMARSAADEPVRNERLRAVAEGLNGQSPGDFLEGRDDFPGSSIAHYDFDGDGQPDFFSRRSTMAERNASALQLDGDIDGDGVSASRDGTPYCADCSN